MRTVFDAFLVFCGELSCISSVLLGFYLGAIMAHVNKEYQVPEADEKRKSSLTTNPLDNVPVSHNVDLSLGSILKGNAEAPLTLFEKKAALINAEIDNFGVGRYQICIWFLCGFGYFLDLAWAQGVGLIASAVYQEMNVRYIHSFLSPSN